MVKRLSVGFAFCLIFAFAAPAFAQDDYPKFILAPGYGNVGFGIPNLGIANTRNSGFTMDAAYNVTPVLGGDIFTGYYSLGNSSTLYTNMFGGTASLRKSKRAVPYGTAGFGFGYYSNPNLGSTRAIGTRYGGGVDVPFKDSMAIRVEATRMGFHFISQWHSGTNISVGLVLNLSQ